MRSLLIATMLLSLAITPRPINGPAVPELAGLDSAVLQLLQASEVPGAAVAVAKDGRLVFARGYGCADEQAGAPVAPDALFRIASVSKPITAAAVLRLVEQGRLDLDEPAFDRLDDLIPEGTKPADPRLRAITIRQLLEHSAGWDRNKSVDPVFLWQEAADGIGVPPPADAETVVRFMLSQPLQFAPGTGFAYSNFGYAVLGRIVERASGLPYAEFVQRELLSRLGIARMQLGATGAGARAPGEVRYHDYRGAPLVPSVLPGDEGREVPRPYGGFYLEAMDAHGGWITSAIDLVRFVEGVDGNRASPDLLESGTVRAMVARPALTHWRGTRHYYALGWDVRPSPGAPDDGIVAEWVHGGSLPGTTAFVARRADGVTWAALFNGRPADVRGFLDAVDGMIGAALSKVETWPAGDLYARYGIAPRFTVTRATLAVRRLVVEGYGLAPGSTILVDGRPVPTRVDASAPGHALVGRRATRALPKEREAAIQVRRPDGAITAPYLYRRR